MELLVVLAGHTANVVGFAMYLSNFDFHMILKKKINHLKFVEQAFIWREYPVQ